MKTDNNNNALFLFSNLVLKLESLNEQKEIKVLHANFITEEITIEVVNSSNKNFKSIVDKIKFLELTQQFIIKTVDFTTGSIVVVFNNIFPSLSQKEICLIKDNKYINAIKELRTRKNIGLAEAKKLVDDFKIKHNI